MSVQMDTHRPIVGMDFGAGATALSKVYPDGNSAPEILALGVGRKDHATVVAEHPKRGVLVGDEAATAPGVTSLYTGFKSPEFERDEFRRPTSLFVRRVVDQAIEDNLITADVHWIFGAPSGWSEQRRDRYAALFREEGLDDIEVIPESRAALLYARESGEVDVSQENLAGAVILIDLGASTLDITYVDGVSASPVDHGNHRLGAALIEREIMRRLLERHPQREALEALIAARPHMGRKIELICREAKQRFFSTPDERFTYDPDDRVGVVEMIETADGIIPLDVRLSKAEMDEVLDTPLDALDGLSWRAALRDDFAQALARLERPPSVVLLTGGPSRMACVVPLMREVIGPDIQIVRGSEPEFAIARGLAIAGQIAVRAEGFRRDVDELLQSGRIERLVDEHLPELLSQLGHAVADGMTERLVVDTFRQWRAGEIRTLDLAAQRIASSLQEEMRASDNVLLKTATAKWQNELRPEIEQLTRPLCTRWGLPPKSLTLPAVKVRGADCEVNVDTAAATDLLSAVADAANVAVAVIFSTAALGGGAALIATTGPFAVVVGFVAALYVLSEGKKEALEKAKSWDIPLALRQLRSEEKLLAKVRAGAEKSEAQLADSLAEQFATQRDKLVDGVSKGIAAELEALATEAELLIA